MLVPEILSWRSSTLKSMSLHNQCACALLVTVSSSVTFEIDNKIAHNLAYAEYTDKTLDYLFEDLHKKFQLLEAEIRAHELHLRVYVYKIAPAMVIKDFCSCFVFDELKWHFQDLSDDDNSDVCFSVVHCSSCHHPNKSNVCLEGTLANRSSIKQKASKGGHCVLLLSVSINIGLQVSQELTCTKVHFSHASSLPLI